MKKAFLFAKLQKVDEEKQEVWGVLAEEVKDKDGEIMDYATSKGYFQAWSEDIAKATDGKSLGNLRSMHNKIAAGKLVHIEFRDAEKQVYIGAKVVDSDEWTKCKEGVYTGFSIGGDYQKAWKDADGNRRYTAKPFEASLVDNPCMYGAQFEAVKMDGSIEIRKFIGGEKPEGNAMKLKKGLCEVCDLTMVLGALNNIRENIVFEEKIEGDGASDVPNQLLAAVDTLAAILSQYAAEEAKELTEGEDVEVIEDPTMENAKQVEIEKVAVPEVKAEAAPEVKPEAIEKVATPELEKASLTKFEERMGSFEKAVSEQNEKIEKFTEVTEKLNKFLANFEDKLMPAKGVSKTVAVSKEEDGATTVAKIDMKDPVQVTKAILTGTLNK